MKWFFFDACKKAEAFHTEVTGFDVEICSQPSDPRPK
jgi:hypothetical protein